MALTTIPAAGAKLRGSVLSSLITEVRPIWARKTADETVNNSAALQNDDALFVSVAANCVYRFHLIIIFQSGTTPDLKYGWTFPVGLTMRYGSLHYATGLQDFYLIQTDVPAVDGTASNQIAQAMGTVIVGANAGTLQLQWAQNTMNASDTIVRAGSSLMLTRTE